MNIKQAILIGLIAFIAVIGLNTYIGYTAASEISRMLNFITGRAWDTADGAMEGQIELEKQIIILQRLHIKQIDTTTARIQLDKAITRETNALDRMKTQGLINSEEINELNSKLTSYHRLRDKLLSQLSGNDKNVEVTFSQFSDEAETLLNFISLMEEMADSKVEGQSTNIINIVADANFNLLISLIISLAMAALIFYLAIKIILDPIEKITAQLTQLSEGSGDLTVRLPSDDSETEVGRLATAFNNFVQKLQYLIGQVQHSNHSLMTASTQITQTVSETTALSNTQLQEITSVANAIQNISDALKKSSDAAERADHATEQAVSNTHSGNHAVILSQQSAVQLANEVEHISNVISHLAADSQHIISILEVIRTVAEQTNLLALNAAIEAASAGETGRGFAVVADEVRGLALRTQESTSSVESIIHNLSRGSSQAVGAINNLQKQTFIIKDRIGKTADAFSNIASAVEHIQSLNVDMTYISDDEKRDMKNINSAIANIVEQARHNQHVNNIARSSREHLETQLTRVEGLLKKFKT